MLTASVASIRESIEYSIFGDTKLLMICIALAALWSQSGSSLALFASLGLSLVTILHALADSRATLQVWQKSE